MKTSKLVFSLSAIMVFFVSAAPSHAAIRVRSKGHGDYIPASRLKATVGGVVLDKIFALSVKDARDSTTGQRGAKIIMDRDTGRSSIFRKWADEADSGKESRKAASIVMVDPGGNEVQRISVDGCVVTDYTISAESARPEALMTESLELTCDKIDRN